MNKISFVFFGTSEFSVYVLDALKQSGLLPSLIVSTPDKPQGRKLLIQPTPSKIWALENSIPVYQPEKLNDEAFEFLKKTEASVFIVASYGKIIPERFLSLPEKHTLNVHPSLLPRFRGPSPIESAILADEKETGITIMRLDKEMDHGPIVAQEKHTVSEWPSRTELEKTLGNKGGLLLAHILPSWISGYITETEQEHSKATYCKKIEKKDAEINLEDDAYENFLKIQAYAGWPQAYFFVVHHDKKIRVIVTKAHFTEGLLTIDTVIPEGKKEMAYADFARGLK